MLLQVEGKRYITVRRKKKKQRQQDAAQGPKSPPLIMGPDAHTAIEQHMQTNPERGLDRKPVQDIAAKDKCTAYTKCTCNSFSSLCLALVSLTHRNVLPPPIPHSFEPSAHLCVAVPDSRAAVHGVDGSFSCA